LFAATNNSLVNEGVDTSFGGDVCQFLNESAGTTADENKELGEIGCAIGKRITSVIDDGGVLRGGKDR